MHAAYAPFRRTPQPTTIDGFQARELRYQQTTASGVDLREDASLFTTRSSQDQTGPLNQFRESLVMVPRQSVLLALNQLSVMSHNGVEIVDALESVYRHCANKHLAESIRRIHESVSSGNRFSTAVGTHGRFFPPVLAPMLSAAEASGNVAEAITKVCQRLREELQMRGTILSAMIYPMILVAASMIVMTALVLGVLPQFERVFESMGKPVPLATELLLSFGAHCRQHFVWILLACCAAFVTLVSIRKHAIIQVPLGRFLMYGPLIRNAYRPLQTGRNFRTIAAMVAGGVPLLQAVRLTCQTTSDLFWQRLLGEVEDDLIDGLDASVAMSEADFLPVEAAQMMATGERTGRVAEVLEDIGQFYEEEAARRIKRLVVAIEPAIILVMGVVVAGVVMSVMLPLLDVSTM